MFTKLALSELEGNWRAIWTGSWLIRIQVAFRNSLVERLAPYLSSSWTARLTPLAVALLVALLVFASPLVSTGMNALLILLAGSAVVLRALFHPPTEEDTTSLDIPLLVLLAIVLIATASSPFPWAAAKGLTKWVIFLLAYGVFRDVFRRGGLTARLVIGAVLAVALLEALLGLYQFKIHVPPLATWEDAEAELNLTRVYGTLRNPNLLGGYLVAVVPLGIAGMLAWRGPLRWLAAGVAIAGPLALYLTYSRGAYVALGAEASMLAILGLSAGWRKQRTYWILGLGLAALLTLSLWGWYHSPTFHNRLTSILSLHADSSNSFRMNVWRATWQMIRDSWWIGVGIGNDAFRHSYSLYMVSGYEALGAYNVLLEWLAEAGVGGAIAFLWLVIAAMTRALECFNKAEARPWAAGTAVALLGLLVHGMVDTVFFRPAVQLPFWLLLAIVVNLPRIAAYSDRAASLHVAG
ncbi:MAG: O-antigen ligase family protein [Cyanobacteria bacterium NC_groundwater_1444_Ag_S-0.65um_54_12]|nr:O-antigen ligase family protein [Cyanobacteria bacterium NC_groundwater_1444_Ag_S-0.65um_54_12]